MSMRCLVMVAAVAAWLPAAQADAVGITRGVDAAPSVGDDALGCFRVTAREHMYAVATAVGVVRTAPVEARLWTSRGAHPTETISEPKVGAGTDLLLCVGGVGTRVVSGTVVYSLVARTQSGEAALVVTCTFNNDGPRCR